MSDILDIILHLDKHLAQWATDLGGWLNAVLFAVIFAETGLVITPFLPGDSLLFAVGALAVVPGSPLDPVSISLLLIVAAVLGDAANYSIGRYLGPRVFSREKSRLLNPVHLRQAQAFYERYGGRAIVIARFVPIVRTFAPFVAGVGRMDYPRFALFNVFGAVVWVGSLVALGALFGGLPIVQHNFHYVVLAIIVISVLPIAFEWWRARRRAHQ